MLATVLVAGLAVTAGPAHAACPTITDATGDSNAVGSLFVSGYWPHSDIVSADVASDSTWLTGVVRLVSLESSPSMTTPGTSVVFQFRSSTGADFFLVGNQSPYGHEFRATIHPVPGMGGFDVPATGVVDLANSEIRVHIAMSSISSYVAAGDVFSQLRAGAGAHEPGTDVAGVRVGPRRSSYAWDVASAPGATYTAGSAGCVTPGV